VRGRRWAGSPAAGGGLNILTIVCFTSPSALHQGRPRPSRRSAAARSRCRPAPCASAPCACSGCRPASPCTSPSLLPDSFEITELRCFNQERPCTPARRPSQLSRPLLPTRCLGSFGLGCALRFGSRIVGRIGLHGTDWRLRVADRLGQHLKQLRLRLFCRFIAHGSPVMTTKQR